MRHWTGTAFFSRKKRYSKNRSACKNAVAYIYAYYGSMILLIASFGWQVLSALRPRYFPNLNWTTLNCTDLAEGSAHACSIGRRCMYGFVSKTLHAVCQQLRKMWIFSQSEHLLSWDISVMMNGHIKSCSTITAIFLHRNFNKIIGIISLWPDAGLVGNTPPSTRQGSLNHTGEVKLN